VTAKLSHWTVSEASCVYKVHVVWCSCGLAALAMAGQLLTGTTLDDGQLLQSAIEAQFSFHGEMFSGLLSFRP